MQGDDPMFPSRNTTSKLPFLDATDAMRHSAAFSCTFTFPRSLYAMHVEEHLGRVDEHGVNDHGVNMG
jgi:hypothetical protein